jgi:uncharacterized protein (DUF1697 family)
MAIHIALLRGVNVGGKKMVAMSELRDMLTKLGYAGARTLLQSGNLVFDSKSRSGAALETFLETETEKRLGCRTLYHVRTVKEWEQIIARNPFPDEAERDPGHLIVLFLKEAPGPKAAATLQAGIKGPELVGTAGRHAYIFYPDGIGRSTLSSSLIERNLGKGGTARNWNTVLKLGALARA